MLHFGRYMWAFEARSRWTNTDVERCTLEIINDHHVIGYQAKKGSGGAIEIRPREFVTGVVWKRLRKKKLIFVGIPTQHVLRPEAERSSLKHRMFGSRGVFKSSKKWTGKVTGENDPSKPSSQYSRSRGRVYSVMVVTQVRSCRRHTRFPFWMLTQTNTNTLRSCHPT